MARVPYIDNAYHPNKNVVSNALSKRPIPYEARLAAMGIQYEDQRDDVLDWHLVAMLVSLTISLTIAYYIDQAQPDD